VLPFTLEFGMHIWPVGNRKCFDVRTSPLVVRLDSYSIRNIEHLHSNLRTQMELPSLPEKHTLGDLIKHDLNALVSLSFDRATGSEFSKDSSAEIILHSFINYSFIWIYRHPRNVIGISLQVSKYHCFHCLRLMKFLVRHWFLTERLLSW